MNNKNMVNDMNVFNKGREIAKWKNPCKIMKCPKLGQCKKRLSEQSLWHMFIEKWMMDNSPKKKQWLKKMETY